MASSEQQDFLLLNRNDGSTQAYSIDSSQMQDEINVNGQRYGIDRRAVLPATRQQLLVAVTRGGMPLRGALLEDLETNWHLVAADPVVLSAPAGKSIRLVWLL